MQGTDSESQGDAPEIVLGQLPHKRISAPSQCVSCICSPADQSEMASLGFTVPRTEKHSAFTRGLTGRGFGLWACFPLGGARMETLVAASPGDLLPVCKSRHRLPEAAGAITWSQTLLVMGNHGLELPQLQRVGTEPPAGLAPTAHTARMPPSVRAQLSRAPAPEGLWVPVGAQGRGVCGQHRERAVNM